MITGRTRNDHSFLLMRSVNVLQSIRVLLLSTAMFVGGAYHLNADPPFVVVLGTAQDGGYPQSGCTRPCCKRAWDDPSNRRFVSSVAVVDPESAQRWLLDCTPDFRDQLRLLDQTISGRVDNAQVRDSLIDGIFPTHAHVGHYAGLIHLGREVMGTRGVPVHCMPRMKAFLETNGPWEQLVSLGQIELRRIQAGATVRLNSRLSLTVLPVPHRDEYSETVAFRVQGPSRSFLYLPDIDKWDRWDASIDDVVANVDLAMLDATFYDVNELPGRDMSEIPHPFITETMERFKDADPSERAKVHFIHMNHSNPALAPESQASRSIRESGFNVSQQGQVLDL